MMKRPAALQVFTCPRRYEGHIFNQSCTNKNDGIDSVCDDAVT